MSARRRIKGFTYIGLLVLIAMMGVALTVASDVWSVAQRRDKEEELLFVGNQFRRALRMYNLNAAGYPRRLEDLLKDPRFPDTRRHLRRIYRDPITGRAEWGLVKSTGDVIIGVYSLSNEEPLKKSGFAYADRDFDGKTKYSEWRFTATAAQPAATKPPPGANPPSTTK